MLMFAIQTKKNLDSKSIEVTFVLPDTYLIYTNKIMKTEGPCEKTDIIRERKAP